MTPPPASQIVKPNGLWSRPSTALRHRRAAELAAPDHQRVFEQAALLEVGQQAGDRLVDGPGVVLVALLQVRVLVPAVVAEVLAEQFDEPHAPLDQPPGDQALAAEDFGYHAIRDKVEVYDLHATMLYLLGFDHTKLTYRFGGRDMRLTDVHGEVVKGILA